MSTKLAPQIRLRAIPLSQLPSHQDFELGEHSTQQPEAVEFATSLLDQGHLLLQPANFDALFKSDSEKSAPPYEGKVEILRHVEHIESSGPSSIVKAEETWFARRSMHFDTLGGSRKARQASWQEFVYGLRDQHSKHEFDFTPTIYDARLVCEWNEKLKVHTGDRSQNPWHSMTMSIYEMCHKMPAILTPRCFPVLVVTGSHSEDEFIVVTVPVDLSACPAAFYSTGRNRKDGLDSQTKKSVQMGQYAAVERVCRRLSESKAIISDRSSERTGGEDNKNSQEARMIEWVMATASDASGNLPVGVQKLGIPGAIAKDVGYFLDWVRSVPEEEIHSQKVGTSTAHQ